MDDDAAIDPESPAGETSLHVRRARDGDAESLRWIIERFSPLIFADARYRLGPTLRAIYDPEDLVSEVWTVALPRLRELPARDGRYTPVILKFLSTALRNKVNNLVQKHIAGKPKRERDGGDTDTGSVLGRIADERVTGVVTRLAKAEAGDIVSSRLARLDEPDRVIIILRGIEQHPYKTIATLLGEEPKTLSVRYGRALRKLRQLLPDSIFAELVDD